jgi:hypothetical protein
MPNYLIKFYRYKTPTSTLREGIGQIPFEASDHPSAAAYADQEFSERLSESAYSILLDETGAEVRHWGSVRA